MPPNSNFSSFIKHYYYSFILFVSMLVSSIVLGQAGKFHLVDHFTNDNGLPQNSINGIAQDGKGFLWISTNNGIARYDGHDFEIYNSHNTQALTASEYGFMRWQNGELKIMPLGQPGRVITVSGSNSFKPVSADTVTYFITTTGELTDFGGKLPSFIQQLLPDTNHPQKPIKLAGWWAYSVIARPGWQAGYWSDGDGTLWYYNRTRAAKCLLPDQAGAGFFLGDSLLVYNPEAGVRVLYNGASEKTITTGPLLSLLYKATNSKKLIRFYTHQENAFVQIDNKLYRIMFQNEVLTIQLLSSEISMTDINLIHYYSKENILLIGTKSSGLYLFKESHFTNLQYTDPATKIVNTQRNSIYAIQPVNDTTLLTIQGTITTSNRSRLYPYNNWYPRIIGRLGTNQLVVTGYAGTYQVDDQLQHPQKIIAFPNGVLSSYTKQADTAYFTIDSTLVRATVKDKQLSDIHTRTIPGGRFLSMLNLTSHNFLYFVAGNTILQATTDFKTIRQLPFTFPSGILSLYYHPSGTIWISTAGEGWFCIRGSNLIKMPLDDKEYLGRIHCFIPDGRGYLWLPTNNGLFRFFYDDLSRYSADDNNRLYYNYYDKTYGLVSSEFNGQSIPAMARLADGRFILPNIQGLVVFNPLKIAPEETKHPLMVENLRIDADILNEKKLELKPNFNIFSMHITSPFYGHTYNLAIEYQLSGGGGEWTKLSRSGNLHFNRLSPGYYTLTIRKANGFGGQYETTVIPFRVLPYWYQTWWFIGCATLLLILLVWSYIRYKARLSYIKQKQLEQEVESRTLELNETLVALTMSMQKLQASQVQLQKTSKFRSDITALVLHDIRSPLIFFENIIKNIYESYLTESADVVRNRIIELHNSVKEITGYTQQLLLWINLQGDDYNTKKSWISIDKLLQTKLFIYSPLAHQKGLKLLYHSSVPLYFETQQNLLEAVLRNLIDNAIKYTEQGVVKLDAQLIANDLQISISDTGSGMSTNLQRQILSDEEIIPSGSNSGLGYRFIKDILKKMDATLHIESELGKGTSVTITILNS